MGEKVKVPRLNVDSSHCQNGQRGKALNISVIESAYGNETGG